MRILVVDDDPAVSGALQRALRLDGYEVTLAGDGPKALEEVAIRPPDAVVLDIGLPTIDGLDVCRRMRAAGDDTPVLMLTARDAIEDRVGGLDAGADDYLVKPFALAELLARLRALLRRRPEDPGETLAFSDLSLDPVTREAHRGDRAFTVTRNEAMPLWPLTATMPVGSPTMTTAGRGVAATIWAIKSGAPRQPTSSS